MSQAFSAALALQSNDAERTVIGALLLDPDAIYKVDDKLASEDFFDPVFRDVYQAIQNLSEKGSVVDFVTVAEALKTNNRIEQIGGSAFLASLSNEVPTASHIKAYADLILEKSRRRQLKTLGAKIADLASDEKQSANELTELAEQEFLKLSREKRDEKPALLADLRNERYDHYTALYESEDATAHYGIQTGFAGVDDKLTGLAPGQLIILAGRPGMGKTALALDIARHVAVAQGKSVSIVSLEMTKEEVFDRLFSKLLHVEAWKLSKGNLTEEQFATMGTVLDKLEDYPLSIDDDPNSTLTNIRSKARRQKMQQGLDLLIVDYLQLIEVTDKVAGENQTQRITYISKSLKRLARELDCPVLALSQLSRECDRRNDKRPQLSDLRDSGSIEQDGDRILMLYRESEYSEDCENPDLTDLFIRKNRHGPTGCIELTFEKKTMTFHDRAA